MIPFLPRLGHLSRIGALRHLSSNELPDLILTNKCVKRILDIQEKAKNAGKPMPMLRVAIDSGGCSGFQYVYELETNKPDKEYDEIFEKNGAAVVVDKESMKLLKGSTLDYVEEMVKSSFSILANPNSASGCSCGTSFAAKGTWYCL